jgi:hypothetical protein
MATPRWYIIARKGDKLDTITLIRRKTMKSVVTIHVPSLSEKTHLMFMMQGLEHLVDGQTSEHALQTLKNLSLCCDNPQAIVINEQMED